MKGPTRSALAWLLRAGWKLSRCDNSPAHLRALRLSYESGNASREVLAPLDAATCRKRDKFYLL